jgi:hypothetical protein
VAALAAAHLSIEKSLKKVHLSRERRLFAGDDPWLGLCFNQYWAKPFVTVSWQETKRHPNRASREIACMTSPSGQHRPVSPAARR